jgi:hypothetical protein
MLLSAGISSAIQGLQWLMVTRHVANVSAFGANDGGRAKLPSRAAEGWEASRRGA